MPMAFCRATTFVTAVRTRPANTASSIGSPRSWRYDPSTTSAGRGRLPTWVVRMRSVLSFTPSLTALGRAVFSCGVLRGVGELRQRLDLRDHLGSLLIKIKRMIEDRYI